MEKQLPFSLIVCLILATRYVYGEQKLYGLYSDELMSGELIIPKKVTATGEFVTHNLTHHHDEHNTHNRRRRSNNDNHTTTSEPAVHYQLPIKDGILHLELEPSTFFLAPNLIVEGLEKDFRTRKPIEKNINCHYHGKIKGQEKDSMVALSACHGLVGHIKAKNKEYYIEPSKHHAPHKIDGHPHVIFQKSDVIDKPMQNSSKEPDNRRQEHNEKPKQALSNCGNEETNEDIEAEIVESQPEGKVKIQRSRKMRRLHNRHQKSQAPTIPPPPSSYANGHERTKRSMGPKRYVEVLVVADATMVAFHDDIETYIMVVMNIVSALFKDPSIGNDIEIVVVRIIYLQHLETLDVENKYSDALNEFCYWQNENLAINEGEPYHHDVAILITRNSLCGNCGTTGYGNMGTMCIPHLSCSVTRDTGISLSNTISHELGHNFGMQHDTEEFGCEPRDGPIVHIMTPTFGTDIIQLAWSQCSRRFITNFLDEGRGECLKNKPEHFVDNPFSKDLPGQRYNADEQCRLNYDSSSFVSLSCQRLSDICSTLWCDVGDICKSNMSPAAAGTPCGDNKVCKKGECVSEEPLERIDGGWSPWSDWSPCSRSCGGGVLMQERKCNNPFPQNGGSSCIGEENRYEMCNVNECPEEEVDFRAQQCAQYNNIMIRGGFYKWLPYIDKEHPCKLYCVDDDDSILNKMQDKVVDGTPCKLGTNNVCINGNCTKVGCDWIIGSDMKADRCGNCGDQDKICKSISMISNIDLKLITGYEKILVLPAKSRNIAIVELNYSRNYLAIAKANSNLFYLNGNRVISLPGDVTIAGAESIYNRIFETEVIKIEKPIEHSIEVYAVAIKNKQSYASIYYEFVSPSLPYNRSNFYFWGLSDWTSCSVSCGGGVKYREPICYENASAIVKAEYCWNFSINIIMERLHQKCNVTPCSPHWITGPWAYCPITCRNEYDPLPVRHRSVVCVGDNDITLDENNCDTSTRPTDKEYCDEYLPICNV